MDLGIANATAIVCSAPTDLGLACVEALVGANVTVYATGADEAALQAALANTSTAQAGQIKRVVCDIRTAEGRDTVLEACPTPDILVNHAPGPPMGDFRDWTDQDWQQALQANLLSAVDLIKRTFDGMVERGFGRIVNITSQSVKSPMEKLDLSNAARAGLTGFVAGVAREHREQDVTINNLLPGLFETQPLNRHLTALAAKEGVAFGEVMDRYAADVPLGRLGRCDEFGALCAFLCSRQAGFINGQNVLIDGGAFRGVV